jgi:hypothetical protein
MHQLMEKSKTIETWAYEGDAGGKREGIGSLPRFVVADQVKTTSLI